MKYLRKKQILEGAPFGATTFYEYMKIGKMPKPVAYLSPTMPVWDADAIDAAIEKLVAEAAIAPMPDVPAEARRVRQAKRARPQCSVGASAVLAKVPEPAAKPSA
jgi:predicted DNA-binding transcriptional regulator AlpA